MGWGVWLCRVGDVVTWGWGVRLCRVGGAVMWGGVCGCVG